MQPSTRRFFGRGASDAQSTLLRSSGRPASTFAGTGNPSSTLAENTRICFHQEYRIAAIFSCLSFETGNGMSFSSKKLWRRCELFLRGAVRLGGRRDRKAATFVGFRMAFKIGEILESHVACLKRCCFIAQPCLSALQSILDLHH